MGRGSPSVNLEMQKVVGSFVNLEIWFYPLFILGSYVWPVQQATLQLGASPWEVLTKNIYAHSYSSDKWLLMRTNLVDGCVDGGVPCLWVSHRQHNLLTGTRIRLEDDSQMKDLPLHPGRPSWSVCSAWRRGNQLRRHSSVQRRTVSTLQEESTIMENGQFCKYWPTLHCVDGCNNINIVYWSFSSSKLPSISSAFNPAGPLQEGLIAKCL